MFDDRIATVLRFGAPNETAACTQYRQLLDLLGSMAPGTASALVDAAFDQLGALAAALPSTVQSAILRAPGLRLRNVAVVSWLARGDPQAAAAAMAAAELSESDWLSLIPRLPMTARGFLRHRRNLPSNVQKVLERLLVGDLVLPEPEAKPAQTRTADLTEPEVRRDAEASIGALVRRIERFQRARRDAGVAPRVSLGDLGEPDPVARCRSFDFASDAYGKVRWADPAMAPLIVGLRLAAPRPGAATLLDERSTSAIARHLPVRGGTACLVGPPEIAGQWRIDAAPMFADGHFAGYEGRMRRPALAAGVSRAPVDGSDRMRELLHELRTPVGAIQGFAELIQQQLFGAAPNQYRALAAAVAVDAARLLAGFDEIDRLVRLESGALVFDEGRCQWDAIVSAMLRRIEGALRPHYSCIELSVRGDSFAVGLADADAQQLAWHILATLGGALAPGEVIDLSLSSYGAQIELVIDLPAALAGDADLFAASAPTQRRTLSSGTFGSGFTLRLARAEARAADGTLERRDDTLRLVLPVLITSQSAKAASGPFRPSAI